MDYQHLLLARDGHLATLTVNRPDKLNALNERLVAELTDAIAQLSEGPERPRVVVLTGAGKAFVAGGDIKGMASMSPTDAYRFASAGHRLCASIEAAPFPVIAAVNGFALGGGCELLLACDLAYAADTAKLGQPEVLLGVIAGFGGTQRLTRRIGPGKARELLYTGDTIGADEALRLGLVEGVFAAAELLPRVNEIALRIASRGPLAVAATKRVVQRGADVALPVACELEAQTFATLFGSADQREGMEAFIARRKASFEGR